MTKMIYNDESVEVITDLEKFSQKNPNCIMPEAIPYPNHFENGNFIAIKRDDPQGNPYLSILITPAGQTDLIERYVEDRGNLIIDKIEANLVRKNTMEFNQFGLFFYMVRHDYFKPSLMPYLEQIENGNFVVLEKVENGKIYLEVQVTQKGMEWIEQLPND